MNQVERTGMPISPNLTGKYKNDGRSCIFENHGS